MLRVNLWRPSDEAFARRLRGEAQPTAADKSDITDNKSDNEILLGLMRGNPGITQAQMSVALGMSRSTVALILKKLQEDGSVVREGSRKSGC